MGIPLVVYAIGMTKDFEEFLAILQARSQGGSGV